MYVDVALLHSFVAVAEELNFSRAADRLYVAQPALSQRIARLERQVDMRLFDRTTRRVELTMQGAALYEEALRLLSANERFQSRLTAISRGRAERLRVGYTASTGFDATPRLVTRFMHVHSEIDVQAEEMWSRDLLSAVRNGRVGVAVARAAEADDDLASEVIRNERLVAVMDGNHRLADRKSLRLRELAEEPLMFFPPALAPGYHAALVGLCHQAGFEPHVVDNPMPGVHMFTTLRFDNAVAVRPESSRLMHPDGMVFVDIEDDHAVMPVVLIWRRGVDVPGSAVRKWLDNARSVAHHAGWLQDAAVGDPALAPRE